MSSNITDDSIVHLRLALTFTHLVLVVLGSVNLLVIFLILLRPYMRSITNVYMIGLCLADFIYLANLILVAATQLNNKSWPFGSTMCTIYHGTESTGKYASVLFVILLAADRYCAMCKASICARYRNYRTAVLSSILAWFVAILFALPLYAYAEEVVVRFSETGPVHVLCIAKWPSSNSARIYISVSSVVIFALPLAVIVFCYYHILNKLREAVKGSKRLRRAASTRAPYHRVTRLVLWVVIFHVICWSPFWLFNLLSAIFRVRISSQLERIVINIIHLFPYINCALNPVLYAVNAENFRVAFRSLFCSKEQSASPVQDARHSANTRSTYYRSSAIPVVAVQNSAMHAGIPPVRLERDSSIHKAQRFLDSYVPGTPRSEPVERSRSCCSSRMSIRSRISLQQFRRFSDDDMLMDIEQRRPLTQQIPSVTVTMDDTGTDL